MNSRSNDRWKETLWSLLKPAIVALIVALLVHLGVSLPQQHDARVDAAGVSHFSSVYSSGDVEAVDDLIAGDDVTVTDDITCNAATLTGSLSAVNVTATGYLAVSGAGSIGTNLATTAATAISVTMNGYITSTGTLQPLTSAGNVGTGSVAAGSAGRYLLMWNQSATTITISDTGILKLSGDAALGQYDTLLMVSDGTNWVEVAQANN